MVNLQMHWEGVAPQLHRIEGFVLQILLDFAYLPLYLYLPLELLQPIGPLGHHPFNTS